MWPEKREKKNYQKFYLNFLMLEFGTKNSKEVCKKYCKLLYIKAYCWRNLSAFKFVSL